ncbi:hypothetical protein DVU_1989 [Nitratidesulfovibrio vulgaris str. Hildenborough]|uniref:Uncharacterized protein n=1 Tax=Nitratidesulfovibrio vulgaris (strain ATCC 29579 / DSM 644 / CCUG 34227 / NCIMB 8303 / VKM B-1760 / Hildenborough) TaxID=882 RepID=Q72AK3_NITV2|nr:hypothetical protein DVU_1989 [Nitratidesulfovibrio vulgaris str. Hildenborough]
MIAPVIASVHEPVRSNSSDMLPISHDMGYQAPD